MAITYGKVPQFGHVERLISKPEGRGWSNLGKRDILGVVLHRMLGTLWGTDGYFRRNDVNALTDYGVGVAATDSAANAGVILKWNDPLGFRSGWASGPVSAPYGDGLTFVNKYGINAVNRRLVSLEISGFQTTSIDAKSLDEIVHFIAWYADEAGISWEEFPFYRVTGMSFLFYHDEFCFGSGKRCPFEYVKSILNTIIARVKAFLRKYQEVGAVVPAPVPTGIRAGDTVRVTEPLNLRFGYSRSHGVSTVMPIGTLATVITDSSGNFTVTNNEYTWLNLSIPGYGTGWAASNWLEKTDQPAPVPVPPEYAEPKPVTELALLNPEDRDTVAALSVVNGVKFRAVFDDIEFTEITRMQQFAYGGSKDMGAPYDPGDKAFAMYQFEADNGLEYYYLSNHARVLVSGTKRIRD